MEMAEQLVRQTLRSPSKGQPAAIQQLLLTMLQSMLHSLLGGREPLQGRLQEAVQVRCLALLLYRCTACWASGEDPLACHRTQQHLHTSCIGP